MYRGIVVDDAAVIRMRLKGILSTKYEIIGEAENGEEAVEVCKNLNPDFVTMDITMAKMNGMESLVKILECCPKIKIIMVSAVGQKKQVFDALNKGAKDFIIKPFEPERVLMSVDRLFEDE